MSPQVLVPADGGLQLTTKKKDEITEFTDYRYLSAIECMFQVIIVSC